MRGTNASGVKRGWGRKALPVPFHLVPWGCILLACCLGHSATHNETEVGRERGLAQTQRPLAHVGDRRGWQVEGASHLTCHHPAPHSLLHRASTTTDSPDSSSSRRMSQPGSEWMAPERVAPGVTCLPSACCSFSEAGATNKALEVCSWVPPPPPPPGSPLHSST